jgi:TBC1 domain family member 5
MLWDGLFAYDPTFELAEWVCVAMLLRIRNKREASILRSRLAWSICFLVIPSDYSAQLTFLLHYPAPAQQDESEGSYPTHHTSLLLRQAVMLQAFPTTSSGASIVVENRSLLKIPTEVPEPPPSPSRRRQNDNRRAYASSEGGSEHSGGVRSEESRRPQQQGPVGLPEMILKGLTERGESLNINKSLMNAVSEIKAGFHLLHLNDCMMYNCRRIYRNSRPLSYVLRRSMQTRSQMSDRKRSGHHGSHGVVSRWRTR